MINSISELCLFGRVHLSFYLLHMTIKRVVTSSDPGPEQGTVSDATVSAMQYCPLGHFSIWGIMGGGLGQAFLSRVERESRGCHTFDDILIEIYHHHAFFESFL